METSNAREIGFACVVRKVIRPRFQDGLRFDLQVVAVAVLGFDHGIKLVGSLDLQIGCIPF